jgi:acetyltransferase
MNPHSHRAFATHAGPPPVPSMLSPALQVRPIAPADARLLGEFVRALSPTSRRRRFHAGVRELPLALLERFARVDGRHDMAFIATALEDGHWRCVGEARYAAVDDQADTREFAVAVRDDRQRSGLGTELLERLLGHARRAGVRWLRGDIQRDNQAMLALARKLGFAVQHHPDDALLLRVARATAARSLQ